MRGSVTENTSMVVTCSSWCVALGFHLPASPYAGLNLSRCSVAPTIHCTSSDAEHPGFLTRGCEQVSLLTLQHSCKSSCNARFFSWVRSGENLGFSRIQLAFPETLLCDEEIRHVLFVRDVGAYGWVSGTPCCCQSMWVWTLNLVRFSFEWPTKLLNRDRTNYRRG